MLKPVYLAGGARTPIGTLGGSLSHVSAPQLGAIVVKAALAKSDVDPARVDEVIFGNVISAGLGQNVARQVSIRAGLSPNIGATTVKKGLGSGTKTVVCPGQGDQMGRAWVVVPGGSGNSRR